MKPTQMILLLGVLCFDSVMAETIGTQNAEKIVNIGKMTGNVINGISDETVKDIIAVFKSQHKADADYIKQLTQTIEDLRSGKVDVPPAAIQAAFAALEKGDASLAESLFEKSVDEELKKAADSNKNAAKALRNLGTLRWWDSQKVIAAYQRATELDPDNADGWNRLGQLFRRVGELDQAIAAYQTVVKLGKKHNDQQEIAMAYGNLGNVYTSRGDLDKAIEIHTKALAIDEQMGNKQGMAEDYGNLGIVYKTRGDLDKAVEMHTKALAITENLGMKETSANQYGNLGAVYEQKGNKAEAKRYYQKSIELFKQMGSPNEKLVQGWLDNLK